MKRHTTYNRTAVALGLTLLLGAAGVLSAPGANAVPGSTTDCNNEARIDQGGDDFLVEAGPGIVYAGIDRGTLGGRNLGICIGAPFKGFVVNGTVDNDDIPHTTTDPTACAVDLLGCKVTAFTVWGNDGDGVAIVRADRSGLPAGNGTTEVHVPVNCVVGVGTSCP